MLRGATIAVALPLAGCAQLFGIADTSGPSTTSVSLGFQRLSIGVAEVPGVQDLTGTMAAFLVSDTTGITAVPAMLDATGAWTAAIAMGTPPVEFTLPGDDVGTNLWSFPYRAVTGNVIAFEHPDPTPAPAGAMIALNVTLPTPSTATESFQWLTAGSWTSLPLAAPTVGATTLAPTFMYAGVTNLGTGPLARLTADDAVFALRYDTGSLLTGVYEATPFDQSDTMDTVTGMIGDAPRDQQLDVHFTATIPATRFAKVQPAVGSTPAMTWSLLASPSPSRAVAFGPTLAAGTIAPTDTVLSMKFANPFVTTHGWRTLYQSTAVATRSFVLPDMSQLTLSSSLVEVVEPTLGLGVDATAALPTVTSINGLALTVDGMTVSLPADQPVDITVATDGTTATLYTVHLIEVADATGARQNKIVLSLQGTQPHWSVPPELFVPNTTYVLRATATDQMYPNLAAGNLQDYSGPLSSGTTDSAVITVVNP